jgi:hypothetical protein
MGDACKTNGTDETFLKYFIWKFEQKMEHGRPRRWCEDNIVT